jgi:LacI family transcriptional regulator, galactose operon repressor
VQTVAKKSASLADIARLAGLSAATVSRVLNGARGPSARTRARVLAAADNLGYRPNVLARAMSTSRSRLIGVVVPDLRDPFFTELVSGVEVRVRAHAYQSLVACSGRDPAVELSILEGFRSYRVEGLIVCGAPLLDVTAEANLGAWLAEAGRGGLPVVQIGFRRGPASLLAIDFSAIAADAAGHLLDLGHRRIGFLASPATRRLSNDHVAGMTRALAAYGLALDRDLIAAWPEHATAQRACLEQLVGLGASAVIGSDDLIAVAAILAARDLDLHVPDDLSVMGMDGTRLMGQFVQPSISTVALPVQAMGERAVEEILAVLAGAEPRRDITFAHQVVPGATTAPPRRSAHAARRRRSR